jgi:hypothetical protein
MVKSYSDEMRRTQVRELFQKRPGSERNELGVDLFYAWLEKRHPELLSSGPDPHEQLYWDLHGLYEQS